MPWKPKDARKKTHRAKTKKQQRQWARVSSTMLERGASEGVAVRAANGVIRRGSKKRKPMRGRSRK
jgi:hypothetical protein